MVKWHVGRARLLALADHLESNAVTPKKFKMTEWARFLKDIDGAPKGAVIPLLNEEDTFIRDVNVCGTAACALGWGTTLPRLHKAGLRLIDDDVNNVNVAIVERDGTSWKTVASGSEEVCENLFGIEEKWSDALFITRYGDIMSTDLLNNYLYARDQKLVDLPIPKTPKAAAKHIRKIVKMIDRDKAAV